MSLFNPTEQSPSYDVLISDLKSATAKEYSLNSWKGFDPIQKNIFCVLKVQYKIYSTYQISLLHT